MKHTTWLLLACSTALASPALAQDHSAHAGHDMAQPAPVAAPTPPMQDHSGHAMASDSVADTPSEPAEGSGTSRLPAQEGPMQGLHVMAGDWMLMAHAAVSLQ